MIFVYSKVEGGVNMSQELFAPLVTELSNKDLLDSYILGCFDYYDDSKKDETILKQRRQEILKRMEEYKNDRRIRKQSPEEYSTGRSI